MARKVSLDDLAQQQNAVAFDEICGGTPVNLDQIAVESDDQEYISLGKSDLEHSKECEQLDVHASWCELTKFFCRKNIAASFDRIDKFDFDNKGISHVLSSWMRIIPQ